MRTGTSLGDICSSYSDIWWNEISQSHAIPLNVDTGNPIFGDFPVERRYGKAKKGSLTACQFNAAFEHKDGVVEAGANIFNERYLYQLRLIVNKGGYTEYSRNLRNILDSIELTDVTLWEYEAH